MVFTDGHGTSILWLFWELFWNLVFLSTYEGWASTYFAWFIPALNRETVAQKPTGQRKSARERYQWVGLSKDMPRNRFFYFFILIVIFKKSPKFYSVYCPRLRYLIRLRNISSTRTLILVPRNLKHAGGLQVRVPLEIAGGEEYLNN